MNFTVPSHLPYPLWNAENSPATDLRSCHGSALAWLGYTLLQEDCPAEAVEALTEALSLNPGSLSIREWRATCYLELDQYDRALADLEDVVVLDSKYATAYNNRGLCYLLMGRTSEALEDLNTAIELNPLYVKAYAIRARIYCILGQYSQAQQSCNLGLLLDPTCEELLIAQRQIFERTYSFEPDTRKHSGP